MDMESEIELLEYDNGFVITRGDDELFISEEESHDLIHLITEMIREKEYKRVNGGLVN